MFQGARCSEIWGLKAQVGVSAAWAASFTALSTGSCSVPGGFSDCPKASVLEISDSVREVLL